MDYTVHGILQARILEWVAFPFSRGSSQPRDRTQVSRIAGGFFTNWAIREAPSAMKAGLFLFYSLHSHVFPWFLCKHSINIFEGTIPLCKYDSPQEGLWGFIYYLHHFAFQTRASVVLPHLPCPLNPYSGQKKSPRLRNVSCFLLVKAYSNSIWQPGHNLQTDSRICRLPISATTSLQEKWSIKILYLQDGSFSDVWCSLRKQQSTGRKMRALPLYK